MRASVALACSLAWLASAPAASAEVPRGPDYVFVADPTFGMEGGVRTFESLGRLLFRYEDALPKIITLSEGKPLGRLLGMLGRAVKGVFLDWPLAEFETLAIHEVFGHGARGREFGQEPSAKLALPGVYCALLTSAVGDACTSFAEGAKTQRGLREQDLAVTFGGLESNYLTAWWINAHVMQSGGTVHHGELLAYAASKLVYAGTFLDSELGRAGGPSGFDDVRHYVALLSDRFNHFRPEERQTIAKKLQTAYIWNFFDPTLIFAAYSTIFNSLWNGDRRSRLPLPAVGETYFYPVPRFNVSPYGAEHYLDLFVGRRGTVLNVYGRVGSSGLASYVGSGARVLGFRPHHRIGLGGEVDLWNQPETLVGERAVYLRENRYGVNVGASLDVSLVDRMGVTAKLAYKTPGYLMGQPLGQGLYGYAGVTISP